MKILIACEESQIVCKAFRKLGHEAYSCDIQECSGGYPDWHIKQDVIPLLTAEWDMMIAFPPCTFLTVTGNKWMKPEYKKRFPDRQKNRRDAVDFFMTLCNAPIKKVAIENPVGIMSTRFKKPDQYIQPYFFGDPHRKKTCLWLKGLPKLKRIDFKTEPEIYIAKGGKKYPVWNIDTMKLPKKERSRIRSKTFQGFATAMANQWGGQNED